MALTTVRPQGMGFNTGRRNLVINGAMRVAQRSSGTVSVADSSNEGYQTLDRFGLYYGNSAGGVVDVSQSTDVPSGYGFTNSYKADVTTADTSISSTHMIFISHSVEAQDVANSGWNHTSSSSYMTLSFWAKSVKAGTYCVAIEAPDSSSDRIFVKEYTLVANTWKNVEITFPGESGVTVNNDNGVGLQIKWTLQAGSNRNIATDDTWNSGSERSIATSNQVNFYDSTDNNFFLTGVQLELGENASDFEHRSFGEELALCQRYFYRHDFGGNLAPAMHGGSSNGTQGFFDIQLPVTMRIAPSTSDSSPTYVTSGVDANEIGIFKNGFQTISGSFAGRSGPNHINFSYTTGGLSAGDAVTLDTGEDYYVQGDAEL